MERGEEAVFAPIDTASDAFGELADDEGRSSSLVLMPRLRCVDSSTASTTDLHDAGVHK